MLQTKLLFGPKYDMCDIVSSIQIHFSCRLICVKNTELSAGRSVHRSGGPIVEKHYACSRELRTDQTHAELIFQRL